MGRGIQLAKHLMNQKDNERVTVHEVRGFTANDLHRHSKNAHAISRGTRCKKFLFSLSLSPPGEPDVPVQVFMNTLENVEIEIGLIGQPRAIVFHEKLGRRHAHCVWSRIDVDEMRAINLPHFKLKLCDISRQLYIDNDWRMLNGLVNSVESNLS